MEIQEIKIGNQTWTTANLELSSFRNGDSIYHAKTDLEWKSAGESKESAWCYIDNDDQKGKDYGKLYNWYAVKDQRGLAPIGWHIPSIDEWIELLYFLGENNASKLMSNMGWPKHDNETNQSLFGALPGGFRYGAGLFNTVGYEGKFWSTSGSYANNAWQITLHSLFTGKHINSKWAGLSVRCIKDWPFSSMY